jgi:acetolactate synthase-1/2/3 large subunit
VPATRGSRFLAEFLQRHGVTHVFFVPAVLMETLAEMENLPIRRMMVHGEKAAAYMADGYARASRRPGICMAQHIGASNLAAGLRDAFLACSPVIALTGGSTPASCLRHAYQEVEDFEQFDCTTKLNARVDDVGRLPDLLQQAFREATSGSPGPVHLRLRGHFGQALEVDADLPPIADDTFACVPAFRPAADASAVKQAIAGLREAERPIIVAGGGVAWSGAQANVAALAERLAIPVTTSLNARGTMLDTHPLSMGLVGGYSRACANRAVAEADVVFFIGSHTGGQVTGNWKFPPPGNAVIQLDIDPYELGRNYPCTPLLGDARTVLQQMLGQLGAAKPPTRDAWLQRVRDLVADWRNAARERLESDAVPIRPERLCQEISNALPEDAVLVCDTGHAGIWSGTMIDFTRPGQRLIRSAGSMGWGFPGSLGVKCALPATPVVCFTGDGAFYYHIAELETAARYGINTVVVVNNNSALSQEIELFEDGYRGRAAARAREMWGFNEIDFARVAEAFGCLGIRVEAPQQIAPALERALAADRPVVIDVVTDHRVMGETAF